MKDPNNSKVREIVSLGSNITGSVGGAIVSSILTGGWGAILGAATVPILTDVSQRVLSRREKIRTGALIRYIAVKTEEYIKNGNKVRDDDFFLKDNINDQSSADEIIEGIIQTTQREHEEKKIKYYANLLTNIAFNKSISKGDANLLIKIGSLLTYRQLCILAICAGEHVQDKLQKTNYSSIQPLPRELISLLQEYFELDQLNLIGSPSFIMSLAQIDPAAMRTEGTGIILSSLMELNTIPMRELIELAKPLIEPI